MSTTTCRASRSSSTTSCRDVPDALRRCCCERTARGRTSTTSASRVWKPVIDLGRLSTTQLEQLITGYITHVRPAFDPDADQCVLEVWGMDRSVADGPRGQAEGLAEQEGQRHRRRACSASTASSSDVARHRGRPRRGGLDHHPARDRLAVPAPARAAQRLRVLRRGRHRPLRAAAARPSARRPCWPCTFGEETNVDRFSLEVNALTPANVAMHQIERSDKDDRHATVDVERPARQLGDRRRRRLRRAGSTGAGRARPDGQRPARPRWPRSARACSTSGSGSSPGEGEVAANESASSCSPRGTVTIKGDRRDLQRRLLRHPRDPRVLRRRLHAELRGQAQRADADGGGGLLPATAPGPLGASDS